MFRCSIFLYFYFIELANACIPTQQIETTSTSTTATTTTITTTTNATTTTTTEIPFPCSTCTKIYNTGCQGTGIPSATDWCVIEDDVPVTYTLGATDYIYDEDTCSSILTCPSGTVSYFLYEGFDLLGNMGGVEATTAYCAESGAEAGVWYADIDAHPYEITQMTCRVYE